MFNQVVGFPEKYVSKQDNKEMHMSQDARQEKLEQKIDQGFKQIQEQYIEINQYLRDKADERRRAKPDGG
jgi:hypothetical protein